MDRKNEGTDGKKSEFDDQMRQHFANMSGGGTHSRLFLRLESVRLIQRRKEIVRRTIAESADAVQECRNTSH